MRRYTNAVLTSHASQIKTKNPSLGVTPEPVRVGRGISCIDYFCLAKQPDRALGITGSVPPDGLGHDQLPHFVLQEAIPDSIDETPTMLHVSRNASQDTVHRISTLSKLSIKDKDCRTHTTISSPEILFQPSLKPTAPCSGESLKPPCTALPKQLWAAGRYQKTQSEPCHGTRYAPGMCIRGASGR